MGPFAQTTLTLPGYVPRDMKANTENYICNKNIWALIFNQHCEKVKSAFQEKNQIHIYN